MRALAAVEFGYGYTKWMLRASDGSFRREMYPSAAPVFRSEADIPPDLDVTPIRVAGQVYAVGPDSIPASGEADPLAPRVITRGIWSAVHLGALARMAERQVSLETTFGPGSFSDFEELIRWKGQTFEVHDAGHRNAPTSTIAVAGGNFCADEWATQQDLESTGGGFDAPQTYFLSLGTGVLHATYAQAPGLRCGVRLQGGTRAVYDRMDVELSSRLGREIKTPTHVYDRAIANGHRLSVDGLVIHLEDVLHRAADPLLDRLFDEAEEVLGGLRRARWVAITGGGAAILRAPVRRRYPWMQPVESTEPQWCVVRGMLRLAIERELTQQEERAQEQELACRGVLN